MLVLLNGGAARTTKVASFSEVPLADASVTEWRSSIVIFPPFLPNVPLADASVTEWRALR